MSEADFPYTIVFYPLTVQYCTVLYCTGSFIRYEKKKHQQRNTNAGGAPIRGGFARPPRSCYVFDCFFVFTALGPGFGMNVSDVQIYDRFSISFSKF